MQAAAPLFEGRTPRSITTQYLAPAVEGPLVLQAALLRAGGSAVATVQAPEVLQSTVLAGPSRGTGTFNGVPAPAAAPPESCPVESPPAEVVPFTAAMAWRRVGDNPMFGGQRPQTLVWLKFHEDMPVDAAALCILLDAPPPALYAVASAMVPIPTAELTVLFTDAPPTRGWVLVRMTTRVAGGGWCVDDSEAWDAGGRLLGQARQTRRVLGEWT